MKHIHENDISNVYSNFLNKMAITKGSFITKPTCSVTDLDWNHMDQAHRPYIHGSYDEAVRIATDKNFAFSLTKRKMFGFPFLVNVTDIRLGEGKFYQIINFFSVFHIHIKSTSTETEIKNEWYIVSSRIFKFLHPIFSRKYNQMLVKVTDEDEQIRSERAQLRKNGFSFKNEKPDYLNCNSNEENLIYPENCVGKISLSDLELDQIKIMSSGQFKFNIRKEESGFRIWPTVCSHEGGPLTSPDNCSSSVTCPWHGWKIMGNLLNRDNQSAIFANLKLVLEGSTLIISLVSIT